MVAKGHIATFGLLAHCSMMLGATLCSLADDVVPSPKQSIPPANQAVLRDVITKLQTDRKRFTHNTFSNYEFFRKSQTLAQSKASWNQHFEEIRTPIAPPGIRLSLKSSKYYPGDIALVRKTPESHNPFVLVYMGEFAFSDDADTIERSFFIYPYFDKTGLEYNTFPPRWTQDMLENYRASKAKGALYELDPFNYGITINWLRNPRFNPTVFQRPRWWKTSASKTATFQVMRTRERLRHRVVQIALEELERWHAGGNNYKERDANVIGVVQDYWKTGVRISYSINQLQSATFQNNTPWSAAFISWVMRRAGAGEDFEYSEGHANYIVAARNNRLSNSSNPFKAYRISERIPEIGDLVCKRRGTSTATYDTIAAGMPTHCDIVTQVLEGELITVGGNVSDAVSKTSVATNDEGFITATPRYFAVIKVGE